MSLKNSSVTLSYEIAGVLTSRGEYEYRERTTSGSLLSENQRFFIKKPAQYSNCYKRVILSEKFVNWAISDEARPTREGSYIEFRAWHSWIRMTEQQRLEYYIKQYVNAFRGTNYQFNIHES